MNQPTEPKWIRCPRLSTEVREQLADFAKVKASAEEYGGRDAASRIALKSIYAHEKELLEELHAAELLEAAENAKLTGQAESTHPAAPTQAGV